MSLFGGEHVHHHGLLAGIGAGAMAVLVLGGMALLLVRRQIGEALVTVAWTVAAGVIFLAVAGAVYVARWLWHKHRQMSLAVVSGAVTGPLSAPALTVGADSGSPAQLPPARPAAIAPNVTLQLPEGISPEVAAAVARALVPGSPPVLEALPAPEAGAER